MPRLLPMLRTSETLPPSCLPRDQILKPASKPNSNAGHTSEKAAAMGGTHNGLPCYQVTSSCTEGVPQRHTGDVPEPSGGEASLAVRSCGSHSGRHSGQPAGTWGYHKLSSGLGKTTKNNRAFTVLCPIVFLSQKLKRACLTHSTAPINDSLKATMILAFCSNF